MQVLLKGLGLFVGKCGERGEASSWRAAAFPSSEVGKLPLGGHGAHMGDFSPISFTWTAYTETYRDWFGPLRDNDRGCPRHALQFFVCRGCDAQFLTRCFGMLLDAERRHVACNEFAPVGMERWQQVPGCRTEERALLLAWALDSSVRMNHGTASKTLDFNILRGSGEGFYLQVTFGEIWCMLVLLWEPLL